MQVQWNEWGDDHEHNGLWFRPRGILLYVLVAVLATGGLVMAVTDFELPSFSDCQVRVTDGDGAVRYSRDVC